MVKVTMGNCSYCGLEDCKGCTCADENGEPKMINIPDEEPMDGYIGSAD